MKKFITLIVSAMLCVNAFGAGDISQVIAVDNNLSPRVRNEVPQASTKMRAAKPFPEKPMRRAAIAQAAAATAQTNVLSAAEISLLRVPMSWERRLRWIRILASLELLLMIISPLAIA